MVRKAAYAYKSCNLKARNKIIPPSPAPPPNNTSNSQQLLKTLSKAIEQNRLIKRLTFDNQTPPTKYIYYFYDNGSFQVGALSVKERVWGGMPTS